MDKTPDPMVDPERQHYTAQEIVDKIAEWDHLIGFWLPNLRKSDKPTMRQLRNFITDIAWHFEDARVALAAQPGQGEPLPSDDEPLRYLINLCHARPNMTSAAMIAELRAVYAAPPTPAHDRECRWCGSKPATNTCCSTARLHGQLAPTPDLGSLIHYPEHWDTAAYPTLADALREIGCSECRGLKRPTPDEAGVRAKFERQWPVTDDTDHDDRKLAMRWWLNGYRAALLGETK